MALIPVYADRPRLGVDPLALEMALRQLPPDAPVVAMIHGFRFAPGDPVACPHDHILALRPNARAGRVVSWPHHLGLGRPGGGLALAFGWPARGTIWSAHASAARSGAALADLIAQVRRIDPGRRVDVIAHSLGARVALAALRHLDAGAVGRMILMAPAEFRSTADAAMVTEAGQTAEVVNVTSRENDIFDFILEALLSAGLCTGLGHGLSRPEPGWLDLQIDHAGTARALLHLGIRLGPPQARVCHWSPYLRPGLFGFYRAFLARRIALADLRAVLPVSGDARWSRLRPRREADTGFTGDEPQFAR